MTRLPDAARLALTTHLRLPGADRGQVDLFIELCIGYAELEREILGDLQFDLPVHAVAIRGGNAERVRAEAHQLADAARELLGLPAPVTGLRRELESHGFRLFEMPLSGDVLGAFLFAGQIAPAFLLNSRLCPGARRAALAHLYCHLLADNDPYVPQVCRATDPDPDESELRAGAFSFEFLMPESAMRPFLESDVDVALIGSYFGLPQSIVVERLQDMGVPAPPPVTDDRWGPSRGVVYPERLVRLALEGMHEGRLDVEEFAAALRLGRDEAIHLLKLSAAPEE